MKHLTACRMLARLPSAVSIRFDMRGVTVWYTVRPGSGTKGRSTYGKQGFQLEGELPNQAPAGQGACTAAEQAEAAAMLNALVEVAARLQSCATHLACRHCWGCLLPPACFLRCWTGLHGCDQSSSNAARYGCHSHTCLISLPPTLQGSPTWMPPTCSACLAR